MTAKVQIFESKLRLARHYIDAVEKANRDYLSGFERSLDAVRVFDEMRLQVETTVEWLIRYSDHEEAGGLLVELLANGYQLLYTRLDTTELQRWCEHGLEVARQRGDVGAEAAHLLVLGYTAQRASSLEYSQPWLEQAYALAQQYGDPRLILRCLVALMRCHRDQRVLDKAAHYSQKVYEIAHQLGDALGIYEYFDTVGFLFYVEGKFDEALNAYEQAYSWALRWGGYRQIGVILTLIGNIHYLQGAYQQAILRLRQALDFSLHTHYPPVIIYTLHALGNALISAQDHSGAQETFLRALRLAEQHHLTESAAVMRAELGVLAYRQNHLPLAVDYLESALDSLSALEKGNYRLIYSSYLVAVHAARKDNCSAERILREEMELTAEFSNDPQAILVVWCAVLVCMNYAAYDTLAPEQRLEWVESAALWAGMVIASPHIAPEDRDSIKDLLPDMRTVLGRERLAKCLQEGEQLDLAEALRQVRDHLG